MEGAPVSPNVVQLLERSGLKPVHIAVIFVFAYFAMFFLLRTGVDAGWWDRSINDGEIVARCGAIVIGVAMFALIRDARAAMAALFGPPACPVSVADLALALALTTAWCLGMHSVLVQLPMVWSEPDQYLRYWGYSATPQPRTLAMWILAATATGILAPLLEEFYFRGMLFNALRVRRSIAMSVVLSAFAFGVIHGRATLLAFGFGVIAAIMFLRYRSLWPLVVVHGAYNLLLTIPDFSSLFLRKTLRTATTPAGWAFEIALAIAFIPLAFVFWQRFRPAREALEA
jgi:membrane protease YdiL (CAAX protease family)